LIHAALSPGSGTATFAVAMLNPSRNRGTKSLWSRCAARRQF
jgi:hypothetical protein